MKKALTIITFLTCSFGATAQLSKGLIAHWPFGNNANDVSGKGHNGGSKTRYKKVNTTSSDS